MTQSNLHALSQPESNTDPLHELIRDGARKLINEAVQAELEALLAQYQDQKTPDGRQAVVRNGYLPERTQRSRPASVMPCVSTSIHTVAQ